MKLVLHCQFRRGVAGSLVIALGGAACATATGPTRADVGAGIASRVGVDPKGLPVPSEKWTAPPDVVLADGLLIDEAVAIALWNNPDFQVTLASLGLARADLVEAGLLRNPIFSLLFPWGPKQLEFTLTWPIDALWQRPKRIADATLNAGAVAEQIVASGVTLAGEVRMSFLDALVAEQHLVYATEEASLAAQAAALADGRLRAGDISEFEARLVRADAVQLETGRSRRFAARDLALLRLRSLLGLPADAEALRLVAPDPAPAAGCSAGPELLKSALAARSEVRAAELQMEAAGARAGLERARILTLTASLDANARGSEGFEIGPGLAVELPVLSQNQGRRARAQAELDQAARRYVAVRAAVSSQVDNALVGLREAQQIASVLTSDSAVSLTVARKQAEGLHQAGEISLLTLLETRQRLIGVETARVDAAFGMSRAVVRLEQALGRGCGQR